MAENDLIALAERCEKAMGPDRELDCLIWCADNEIEATWAGEGGTMLVAGVYGVIGWIDPGKTQRNFTSSYRTTGPGSIPAFSASIDAAMTLVPEGHGGQVTFFKAGNAKAFLWQPYPLAVETKAATPALAICAAALRARAAISTTDR